MLATKRIGYLIKQVFLLNQGQLNTIFAEFDLTGAQVFTLIFLFKAHERHQTVYQKDIEKEMDISNPTVTGILNRLEAKGLIQRVISHQDARAKSIVVTAKALELDKILKHKFQENEQQLIASLTQEEAENLELYLKKILCHHDA